jgi:hypothetical protein
MRIRHRVPSIFNLSMVDVLCCALGCVILLWLLNLREARQKADEAGETERLLTATRTELASTTQDRDALHRQLDDVVGRLTVLTSQARALEARVADEGRALADTEKQLQAMHLERDRARGQAADLDKALAALRLQKKDVVDRLARQAQDYAGLEKQLVAATRTASSLEGRLRDKGTLAESLTTKLTDAEAALRKLQALADQVPALRDEVKQARDKLALEEELAKGLDKQLAERMRELALAGKSLKDLDAIRKALEKDLAGRDKELAAAKDEHAKRLSLEEELALLNKRLADAGTRIEDLQSDRKTLRHEADRLRASAESRFAGLSLTGRRVIFLVDMSGSMELVDENTAAPSKWQGVRETLAKILRSSPDLEDFQVIVFAEKPSFLLGEEGRWLRYDPKTSADRAVAALARVKPDGGTNMYSAIEAAFRYRDKGLDTIYVLSDGLPNLGAGLDPQTAERMTEQAKGEVLGRYIRRTLKDDWNRPVADWPRVRINTVGFFYESPDVGAFLWAMSRENDGSFVGMSKP